jgi:signal transduction histidine kinase/ActR/RegA family two-component response regulator
MVPLAVNSALRLPSQHGRTGRYLLAIAIVGGATLLRAAADPWIHNQIPYFIYVASVVVATWFCGVDGGVLSTVVAAFAGNYFFVPPRYEFIPHGEDWIAMSMFSAVGFGLVGLVGRWRNAESVLRAHAVQSQEQAEELRVLHAEAERANRVKDEFLATLSHELRTPLNAILGWAHMLEMGRLDPAHQRKAICTIVRNARAQTHLVNDVLDVSRIISGKMQLALKTVDLVSIVSAAIETIRPAARARSIEIQANLPPHLVLVGDAGRLQQIAWNLLSNAVKFTPKHGRVAVNLETRESLAVLVVSDTGIGIDAEFLPHVFERFRQADSSTTRQHGGLGLGLAVVRHLVELHGGTVQAESAGPDRGATFTIALPVRAIAVDDRSSRPTDEHDLATVAGSGVPRLAAIRVLAVDDEPDARELVQAALTEFGATVRTVSSAQEAIEALGDWLPDVLVCDIGMPFEDGYELIRMVRALPPENGGLIPAVALTAYARSEDRSRMLAAGYQEHLAKPVAPDELALVVETLAAERGPLFH